MKMIKKETDDKGRTILTCEEPFWFFWTRERKFLNTSTFVNSSAWLEFPNMIMINDIVLKCQLDAWEAM